MKKTSLYNLTPWSRVVLFFMLSLNNRLVSWLQSLELLGSDFMYTLTVQCAVFLAMGVAIFLGVPHQFLYWYRYIVLYWQWYCYFTCAWTIHLPHCNKSICSYNTRIQYVSTVALRSLILSLGGRLDSSFRDSCSVHWNMMTAIITLL